MLVSCGKTSNTIDGDMVTNVVQHVASVISQETDTSYLASLFKCATDCLRVWGMEEFALEDMAKMLGLLDTSHPLLMAISSVRDLGLGLGAWDSDGQGGDE